MFSVADNEQSQVKRMECDSSVPSPPAQTSARLTSPQTPDDRQFYVVVFLYFVRQKDSNFAHV